MQLLLQVILSSRCLFWTCALASYTTLGRNIALSLRKDYKYSSITSLYAIQQIFSEDCKGKLLSEMGRCNPVRGRGKGGGEEMQNGEYTVNERVHRGFKAHNRCNGTEKIPDKPRAGCNCAV